MAPIKQVGYLRCGRDPQNLSRFFAVLFNGDLSLFPCEDTNRQYFDPTSPLDGPPEVFNVKGAFGFVNHCANDLTSQGAFTLVGANSAWRAEFITDSREEALVWVARVGACTEPPLLPSSFHCASDLVLKELSVPVEVTPDVLCPGQRTVVNMMKRMHRQDAEEIVVGSTVPNTPRRVMLNTRLASLKDQLQERTSLLEQLEQQEKQFVGGEKDDYHPCRFSTTAKTSFCLLNGNDSTEVQYGDKIVVFGLKEDFTWRCSVNREVSAVITCRGTGQPGCDLMHCERSGCSSQDVSLHGSDNIPSVSLSTDGTSADEETANGQIASAKPAKVSGSAPYGSPQLSSVRVQHIPPDQRVFSRRFTFAAPASVSIKEAMKMEITESSARQSGIDKSKKPLLATSSLHSLNAVRDGNFLKDPTTSFNPSADSVSMLSVEDTVGHYDVSVSAKEISFPLFGALPSVDVLAFVGEEAVQALAAAQLAHGQSTRNSVESSSPMVTRSAGRIMSVARRLASSMPVSRESSPNTKAASPKSPVVKSRSVRQRLSTVSTLKGSAPPTANTSDQTGIGIRKFSFRRCSSASAGCSPGTQSNLVVDMNIPPIPPSPDFDGEPTNLPDNDADLTDTDLPNHDSSSDEDTNTMVPEGERASSLSNGCQNGGPENTDSAKRSATDLRMSHSLPHHDERSPIYRGIVESMHSGSQYDIDQGELPSQSVVCQKLHTYQGSLPNVSSSVLSRERGGSISSASSPLPVLRAASSTLSAPFLNAWDNECDVSIDTPSGPLKTVQFDWPSLGLHLSSVLLDQKPKPQQPDQQQQEQSDQEQQADKASEAPSKKAAEVVIVTYVEPTSAVAQTTCEPGDAVVSINEHRLDNCCADDAWNILNSISSTSVRLVLLPIDGLLRLEVESKQRDLYAKLFRSQFEMWRLLNWESSVRRGEIASMFQMDDDMEDSSDEETLV